MAKRKSHEEEIQRGFEELQRTGFALGDASPALIPRLKEQFGKAKETDFAIIFALGKIVDASSADLLAGFEKEATDKDLKKEIRRSLFKLSQRGLAIPKETAEAKFPTPLLQRMADIEAYMSPVDGAGGRLVWIAKLQPSHGLQLIQAMISDREGLQRIGGARMRRQELRKMAQEIKKTHGVTMIAVPWQYADAMLYEAFEQAKPRGRSGLEQFHELRAIVNTGKPTVQDHPVYRRLDADSARGGAWRELSRSLLDEPEFRFWILDEDWMQLFLPQVQEAQASRLVLNPLQKEERIAGIVRDAVKTLCAGEPGKVMQRRMEDLALYFVETGREELAKLALAVALQIKQGDPGPLDISFLTGLVQKSFAFYLSQQKTKAEEALSLIVKP